MRLSVIVPTNRDRGYIDAAVASVLRNITPDDEVLIVGNGCSPEYRTVLNRHAQPPVIVMHIDTLGVAYARMAGARAASGDYLLFLDDDDELVDGGVQALRRVLDSDAGLIAAFGQVIRFGAVPTTPMGEYHDGPQPLRLNRVLVYPPISPGAGVIRRSAFERTSGFVHARSPAEDWDAWLHLASAGDMMGFPIPMLRYRMHDQNASRDVALITNRALDVFSAFRHARGDPGFVLARRHAAVALMHWYGPQLWAAVVIALRTGGVRKAFHALRALSRLNAFAIRDRLLCKVRLAGVPETAITDWMNQ